jgi:hypothetical protein
VNGQQSKDQNFDARLLEIFDTTYLTRLASEQPVVLRRLEYYLDHAYYITEDAKINRANYPIVKIENVENFNIMKLERTQQLHRHPKKEISYQIEGTNKVLVYLSAEDFTAAFNKREKKERPKYD